MHPYRDPYTRTHICIRHSKYFFFLNSSSQEMLPVPEIIEWVCVYKIFYMVVHCVVPLQKLNIFYVQLALPVISLRSKYLPLDP